MAARWAGRVSCSALVPGRGVHGAAGAETAPDPARAAAQPLDLAAVPVHPGLDGIQDMWANDFARVRSVGTGSWITRSEQGHGYGTQARAAVLELAFGQLGADEACTEYLEGNDASERVSRKMGYTGNGQHLVYRDDAGKMIEYRLRLDRQAWEKNRDEITCSVTGIEPCLAMFGLVSIEQDQGCL
jgi:hypothetical protein